MKKNSVSKLSILTLTLITWIWCPLSSGTCKHCKFGLYQANGSSNTEWTVLRWRQAILPWFLTMWPENHYRERLLSIRIHAAVIWLKYCRYGIKHYPIHQSIGIHCTNIGKIEQKRLKIYWTHSSLILYKDQQFDLDLLISDLG